MHLVFSQNSRCLEGIESGDVDEFKLAGLLGMTVQEGPHLPGPVLKGHWRGFTVEIGDAPRTMREPVEGVPLFPQPKEFLITFHLRKTSDVEIGIRHRALDAVGIFRPKMVGTRKIPLPPDFGREYLVRGPNSRAVTEIVDKEMQSLIRRLSEYGAPELSLQYSILIYRGPGSYLERYKELPGLLGAIVEIARHIDSKLTIGLGEPPRRTLRADEIEN